MGNGSLSETDADADVTHTVPDLSASHTDGKGK
jgi:hypothetical protein